ncbi:hypothetical protein CLV59_103427 [Chitinophaga dinghuensis]|uniref:Uncharacterized protein n=1 Tax=Chitinophaga dinghuensis TaxID=1539050 RepID=A0A327W2I9_9BACT|nr:hypothetical protein [Chitinophaga dinghuensis]RAJ83459.1 hypothetical protein CLV59_103427 [Chitinophaga dinghuensis]
MTTNQPNQALTVHSEEVQKMLTSFPRHVYVLANSIMVIFLIISATLLMMMRFPITYETTFVFHDKSLVVNLPQEVVADIHVGSPLVLAFKAFPENMGYVNSTVSAINQLDGDGQALVLSSNTTGMQTDKGHRISPASGAEGTVIITRKQETLTDRILKVFQ